MRTATQIDPMINPRNSADILIGSSLSKVSITDESANTAARMPTSSDTNQTHSIRFTVVTNPETSPVSSSLRA